MCMWSWVRFIKFIVERGATKGLTRFDSKLDLLLQSVIGYLFFEFQYASWAIEDTKQALAQTKI